MSTGDVRFKYPDGAEPVGWLEVSVAIRLTR